MDVDWRTTHRELSEEDLRFRELAQSNPELLDGSQFVTLLQDKDILRFKQQPWPTFIGPRKLAELKRVSLDVCNLIRGIPSRIFKNNIKKIDEFYGLGDPSSTAIMLWPPNGIAASVARGDFMDTTDGLQCLEFNFTPNLGGWETSILVELHQRVPATSAFLSGLQGSWSYTPTMRLFFRHVLEEVRAKQVLEDELTVAFVLVPSETPARRVAHLEKELARACAEIGLQIDAQVFTCKYYQLERRDETFYVAGRKIHAIADLRGPKTPPYALRAFKKGGLALFNGPAEKILTNKRNVALLSEHASSDIFSPEEREVISKHIPWSRRIYPQRTTFHGEQVDLAELLENARERLVLKEASSFGGKAVWLGQFTSPAEWSQVIEAAFASANWIVQEKLESLPYLYQSGDYGCSIHDVIWGPFFFGSTYGGTILRMQPKADHGAVNLSIGATEGIVLEV
jgi:hypothetical protein